MLKEWYNQQQWCKGHAAVNSKGTPVPWDSPDATAWDLTSAIKVSYKTHEWSNTIAKVKTMQMLLYRNLYDTCEETHKDGAKFSPLWQFNDHAEVDWSKIRKLLVLMDV